MACEEHWWSNNCDSKHDIRYNPDKSPDISSLDPLFSKAGGFWIGEVRALDANFTDIGNTPSFGIPGRFPNGPKPYAGPTKAYFNITISKTRWEQHDAYVRDPAPLDFCNGFIPPGMLSVGDDGVCGETGYAWAADLFKASTHEKDDTLRFVAGTGSYSIPPGMTCDTKMTPVGSLQLMEIMDCGSLLNTFVVTFDASYSNVVFENTVSRVSGGAVIVLNRQFVNLKRVESGEEWLTQLEDQWERANITDSTRSAISMPIQQCIIEDGRCPDTQKWCDAGDASELCPSTPYSEETTVDAGVIAGFSVMAGVIVIAAMAFFYKISLQKQRKRIKTDFALRVVETIEIRPSGDMILTADALKKEFDAMDSGTTDGGDGFISKEELWTFMASGKLGNMDKKDFETLFLILDVDKNGKVDFLEFAQFLSFCGVEMKKAAATMEISSKDRENREGRARRTSVSLATSHMKKSRMALVVDDDDIA